MNVKNLTAIVYQYIERFEELNAPEPDGNDEGYKWRAESCFKSHWDIDSANFADMYKEAMSETKNLINSSSIYPVSGISMLMKFDGETEFVRNCFRELFSEDNGDLRNRQSRIDSFVEKINSHIDKRYPGTFKYLQNLRSVIYYLNLWKPEDNYIYKYSEATEWADCIEFGDDFGCGQSFSLEVYYRMCGELLAELPKYDELMRLHRERFAKEARDFDDELHILVYDIIYCAYHYGFYRNVDIRKGSTKERVARAKQKEKRELLEKEIIEMQEQLRSLEENVGELPDLIGKTVTRKAIGKPAEEGVVKSCACGHITVDFPSKQSVQYVYPDAFAQGYLKYNDENILEAISKAYKDNVEISTLRKDIERKETEIEKM